MIKRSINHGSFAFRAENVREAPFAGTPYLNDARRGVRAQRAPRTAPTPAFDVGPRYLSSVPGEAPRFHPPFEGQGIETSPPQEVASYQAGFPCRTHSYHLPVSRYLCAF